MKSKWHIEISGDPHPYFEWIRKFITKLFNKWRERNNVE